MDAVFQENKCKCSRRSLMKTEDIFGVSLLPRIFLKQKNMFVGSGEVCENPMQGVEVGGGEAEKKS